MYNLIIFGSLRKRQGIPPGYHMNKEHWITLVLNRFDPTEKIYRLIEISFHLTKKTKHCSC